MNPSALPDDTPVDSIGGLALTLGGSPDSFTGDLLRLIHKADPDNFRKLRAAFPVHVGAYQHWIMNPPMPARAVRAHADYLAEKAARGEDGEGGDPVLLDQVLTELGFTR